MNRIVSNKATVQMDSFYEAYMTFLDPTQTFNGGTEISQVSFKIFQRLTKVIRAWIDMKLRT